MIYYNKISNLIKLVILIIISYEMLYLMAVKQIEASPCENTLNIDFHSESCNNERLKKTYPRATWPPGYYDPNHKYTTMYLIFNVDSYSEICPKIVAKRTGLYYICHIDHEDLNISDTELILTLDNFAMRPKLISEMSKNQILKLIERTKHITEDSEHIVLYKNFIIDRFSEELKKKQYE